MAASAAHAADLGKNLAGETCQLSGAALIGQPATISCGGSTDVAGQLSVTSIGQGIPTDPAGRRAALERVLSMVNTEANCGDAEWHGRLLLRICTLKSNGWPRVLIGMEAGSNFYQASGIPSSLPVLEAALASQSQTTVAAADTAAVNQSVQTKISSGVVHASGADYTNYKTHIESARLAGAADNYAAAEAGYRDALAIEQRLFGPNSIIVGQTLTELALQVSNQGRFAEAAALFRRAGPIIEGSSDNGLRARYDSYLALDAANQRHYADALQFARQATAARRAEVAAATKENVSGDPSGGSASGISQGELAHDLRVEAEMALRVGDTASARAAAEESLWIVSEEPGLPLWWRSDTVALMGEINEREGRVVTAEHDFRDARDLDVKIFGDTAPAALSNLRLAEFYTRQQLYGPALDAYKLAFDVAAKDPITRRQIYPDDVVQYITAATGNNVAVNGADIFRVSQFASNGVADQTIARVAAREAAGNTALSDLIAQLHQATAERDRARVDLAAESARPNDERSAELEDSLNAKLKLASARADELSTKVRQSFPDYSSLAEPVASDLAAVQGTLAPDAAMVFFIVGEDSSYALVVRRDGFASVPLAIGRDALTADVTDLRSAFVPVLGRVPEYSLKNAYALYQTIFAPVEPKLAGVDHLVVVPGGPLASFPLSLLVSENPGDGHDYSTAAWLVKRYAISVTPSPRAFLSLKEEAAHHAPAPRPFLGVGAPSFQGASGAAGAKALADLSSGCREAGPVSADLLRALPPLPGTGAEVQTVAARLGGANATVLLGGQATEANLRTQALNQYSVLYFATHGILPGQMHCESEPALALSPPAGGGATTVGDGMLTASEIAGLRLNADLVVLSACNTAEAPDGLGGGALEGLSDAFFAAGARAVLASHWEVPSTATATLMTGVFTRTNSARGVAEALRQSQLSLISQPSTAHPFNWAAFTVIGDGQALSTGEERSAQLTDAGHP
ncbi:MAG TPA: CHAT domain-containing tetratricopeptide repeat protein [Rhizomicrobium sp.]|nr:CHAT domain-containing tetratricopeptide repeat protein [Rhizomicrobium sp.]